MILLFDTYNEDSLMLHASVLASQVTCTAVSVLDNGFLPTDVRSPYMETIGQWEDTEPAPLYFDKVKVPRFWEIRHAGGRSEIWDDSILRGRIYYIEPAHKRFVSVVEWVDRDGKVFLREHYNQWGRLFAKTFPNAEGKEAVKHFYDRQGRLVLTENNVTGTIIVSGEENERISLSRAEFIADYLRRNHWDQEAILYNSLSTPFHVSNHLKRLGGDRKDVLFWHEDIRGQIPGNMKMILEGDSTGTGRIFVLKDFSIRELSRQGVEFHKFSRLGYVHPDSRENLGRREVLIMTNSDRVENISQIVERLPGFHFHIAALTTMSDKLLALSEAGNVRLYPNIPYKKAEELFAACDYYLDINRGSEILSALQKAYFNNMLILAFRETVHHREYVSNEALFPMDRWESMVRCLESAGEDEGYRKGLLREQRRQARAEKPESFQKALVQAGLVPEDTELVEKWQREECRLREKYLEPQICLCVHDKDGKYAREVGATMQSVMWHISRKACFHILCDNTMTEDNRAKLTALALWDGHRIEFHSCEEKARTVTVNTRQYTVGTLYRMLIPEMLPELDRVLYLDADLLVTDDICKLWDIDIEEYAMSGVREYDKIEPYFNAGVLCMNLRRLRADGNLFERGVAYITANDPSFPDQDALNYLYASDILTLEKRWNIFAGEEYEPPSAAGEGIYHYGGSFINMQQPSPIDLLMIKAYGQTPWGLSLVKEKIAVGVGRHKDVLMMLGKFLRQVTVLKNRDGRKIRKVYIDVRSGPWKYKESLLSIMPPSPGDYYVDSQPSGVKEADGMPVYGPDKLKGEKKGEVLFLMRPTPAYYEICDSLRRMGFTENEDFFNTLRLLQRRQGGYGR